MSNIEKIIDEAWKIKDQINKNSDKSIINAINQIIEDLDQGKKRVAEKINDEWTTHQYIKKAVMLSFRIHEMEALTGPYSSWYDKAHLIKGKTANWGKTDFEAAGFRMVPNSPVRKGSYIAKNVVLMPCFVNIGAYIDSGTMMDTGSRAGSCEQIGKNCHISAGTGIGGVLEPAQALPTIIEDNVFCGSMGEIVEGVIVGEGSVLMLRLGLSFLLPLRRIPTFSESRLTTLPVTTICSTESIQSFFKPDDIFLKRVRIRFSESSTVIIS